MKAKKSALSAVITIILSMLALPAFSQIKFGVKGDIGLNNPTLRSDALQVENMTTYSIGPSLEAIFPLVVADVGVEASLLYNDNRMTVSNLESSTQTSTKVANRYLKFPVNAKVKFGLGMLLPLRMYITAGPYAAYLISGDKIDLGGISEDIKAKSIEAGTNIGLGFELLKMIQIGVNYGVKLTDNYSTDEPEWDDPLNGKTSYWSIVGSVYF